MPHIYCITGFLVLGLSKFWLKRLHFPSYQNGLEEYSLNTPLSTSRIYLFNELYIRNMYMINKSCIVICELFAQFTEQTKHNYVGHAYVFKKIKRVDRHLKKILVCHNKQILATQDTCLLVH